MDVKITDCHYPLITSLLSLSIYTDNYWGDMDETAALHASRQIVIKMKEAGINLVALDFDFTVIDVHTGGRWQGSADELATHIRPFFRFLIPEVNQAGKGPRSSS